MAKFNYKTKKDLPSVKDIKKLLTDAMQVLDYERIRIGKDGLSKDERLSIMTQIRDSAMLSLQKTVLQEEYTGTGALTMVIERIDKQIALLNEDAGGHDSKITISWKNE